jgi:hypothetical protein
MTYEYVPSGFEIVINNKEICPESSGGIWNLWWNVKLTDDPEAWDKEIKLINKLQDQLVELSLDHRLIRAQMTEFCRLHPPFPQSIGILCKEIGDSCFSDPVKMGCEGRSLLDSLGYHDLQSINDQRNETVVAYIKALEKWLIQGLPENPMESKVFGFLSQPTNPKKTFVEQLISVIDSKEPSLSSLKELSGNVCLKTNDHYERLGFRPFNCFRPDCWPKGDTNLGKRICCYFMFIDAGLLCAGTFNEERSMFDEFRCFIEENVLAYSLAINSWLKGERTTQITSLITPRYITKETAVEISEGVHSLLGEKDDTKVWLTACLLKTIKDNQRWHKRTELIDDFPEAVSWLKEKQQ